ncbi:unnamed protein product [Chrysoparadoxa australica]
MASPARDGLQPLHSTGSMKSLTSDASGASSADDGGDEEMDDMLSWLLVYADNITPADQQQLAITGVGPDGAEIREVSHNGHGAGAGVADAFSDANAVGSLDDGGADFLRLLRPGPESVSLPGKADIVTGTAPPILGPSLVDAPAAALAPTPAPVALSPSAFQVPVQPLAPMPEAMAYAATPNAPAAAMAPRTKRSHTGEDADDEAYEDDPDYEEEEAQRERPRKQPKQEAEDKAGGGARRGAGRPPKKGKKDQASSGEKAKTIARESRKRKRMKVDEMEGQVKKLQEENESLRIHVTNRNERTKVIEARKMEMEAEISEILRASGNADKDRLIKALKRFKDLYADYGKSRKEEVQFHLKQLETLILPTQTTKMSLWTLEQDESFYQNRKKGSLSQILTHELGVSEDQIQKITERRARIKALIAELKESLNLVSRLQRKVRWCVGICSSNVLHVMMVVTPTQWHSGLKDLLGSLTTDHSFTLIGFNWHLWACTGEGEQEHF